MSAESQGVVFLILRCRYGVWEADRKSVRNREENRIAFLEWQITAKASQTQRGGNFQSPVYKKHVMSDSTAQGPIALLNDATFQWRAKSVWRKALIEMFPDVLTKEVVAHILANRPEFFVSDDMSWIERSARDLTGFDGSLFNEFDRRFPLRFPFIRVFHAGRPTTRNNYRNHGLRLVGLEHLKTQAIEIFGESPALRKAMNDLDNGISRYTEDSGNKIFFCLDRREAVSGSGHYLKYGSEYLLGKR